MSLLLSIYTEHAHEDVRMPVDKNADLQAVLSQEKFHLGRDLKLELENLDGFWRFKDTGAYTVTKGDESWMEKPFDGGDILRLECENTVFTILVLSQSSVIGGMEKFDTGRLRELSIGTREDRDIVHKVGRIVSSVHANIRFHYPDATLQDTSVNGVYVNGRRCYGTTQLQFGDEISIFGLKMVYLVDTLAVNTDECGVQICEQMKNCRLEAVIPEAQPQVHPGEPEHRDEMFHRSPRKIIPLETQPEEIEGPPQRQIGNRKPVWMIIGPSFTMAIPMLLGTGFMALARNMSGMAGSAFMYIGLVTAVASAIVGITWAIINMNYSKKEEWETELLRQQKYGEYLMECTERIRRKYEFNRKALQEMYPDAQTCSGYWRNQQELWNRNRSHQDLLSCRLGLGDIPFQIPISVPKKKFTLDKDALTERPQEIRQTYAVLNSVPINVDLAEHRIVGLVGKNRTDVARCIITQLAANSCYTDVRMAILGDGSSGADFSFMKWLPHVWNDGRSQRYVALDRQEIGSVCYELTQIFRGRAGEAAKSTGGRRLGVPTQYVVLVESPRLLEEEAVAKYLLEDPDSIGVTTLLLAPTLEELPNSCTYVVENSKHFSGMYSMVSAGENRQKIHFDYVSQYDAEQFARRISGIRVPDLHGDGNLPDSLTFFEMLGVSSKEELNVLDNWKKNRTYQTMQAMVGWKIGGQPCYLNIHEKHHGPHGLIAGTTGSGKSETLQTYILSLAVNYSPKDVGFFLIDYKGGGMANLFGRLPHVLGTISNLSGNQIRRAMVSIKSENLRRQRIFSEFGVNHIDAYTKLVKSGEARQPMPHLFIVIDEFAELKKNQQEFMRELISVAQVGRSLGVHLILATQKPFGTVDENIVANTKFRLCLRVADKRDSHEMLNRPDAAYLTQAGRCYLQVGNDEIYEQFQSGWSGAVYDEDTTLVKNNYAVQLENSGRVVMTGNSNRAKKMAQRRLEWITKLVECCHLAHMQISAEQSMMDGIYRNLKLNGIDYEDSEFNRRVLTNFVECYSGYFLLKPEKAAQLILTDAELSSRRLPDLREKTQLEVVVEYLDELAQDNDYSCKLKLWMPALPQKLLWKDLSGNIEPRIPDDKWNQAPVKNTLRVTVGMVDDPQNQNQFPLTVDFLSGGHMAVCGAVSSGKSVLMQTLANGLIQCHTPDMVNLYMIDYSARMLTAFEDAPHVGGLVCEGETDKLDKLFMMMLRMIQERKNLFRGGGYRQYVSSFGNKIPAVVLMIDGYASFREKTENAYEAQLLEIAREGTGLGIILCIASGGFGPTEIQLKIAEKMRQVLTLEMDSKYSYTDCLRTSNFDVLPEAGVSGRGLAICGESVLEYQTALAAGGNDFERNDAIKTRCREIAGLWKGRKAAAIPQIPKNPTWELFTELDEYQSLVKSDRFLPLGYDAQDASLFSLDLSQTFCYHISGRERTGKSVFLRNVACAARDRGARVVLIDKMNQETERLTAQLVEADYINTITGLIDFWGELNLTVNKRHVLHKQLVARGADNEEIFLAMRQYQQIFVLLADVQDFINSVNGMPKPAASPQTFAERVDPIIARGAQHQVFFFGAVQLQDQGALAGQKLYRSFISDKKGVHLGGELNNQKFLTARNLSYTEQTKTQKPGIGYVNDREEGSNVEKIVIPANRGTLK